MLPGEGVTEVSCKDSISAQEQPHSVSDRPVPLFYYRLPGEQLLLQPVTVLLQGRALIALDFHRTSIVARSALTGVLIVLYS